MKQYRQFYQANGVRRFVNFGSPILKPLAAWELPKNSAIHCVPESRAVFGPDPTDFLFNGVSGGRYITHAKEFFEPEGNPIRKSENADKLAILFRRKYNIFRPIHNDRAIQRDQQSVVVYNYGLLPHLFRYNHTFMEPWYQFSNMYRTVLNGVKEALNTTIRHQFIKVNIPKEIPTRTQMALIANLEVDRRLLSMYSDYDTLMLRDLWLWLSDEREKSLFNVIPSEHYENVSLVFTDGPYYSVVNLRLLNEWRKAPKEEIEAYIQSAGDSLNKQQKQFLTELSEGDSASMVTRRFLDYVNAVAVSRQDSTVTTTMTVGEDGESDLEVAIPDMDQEEEAESDEGDDTLTPTSRIGDADNLIDVLGDDEDGKEAVFEEDDQVAYDFGKNVAEAANQLAEAGLITRNEVKRYERLSNKVNTIANPFGSGTLADLANLDPAAMKTLRPLQIPDMIGVPDKTMLTSSLANLDTDYARRVLPAHVAQMVLHAEKAGIIITDYQVERIHDAGNHYDSYVVRMEPVGGAPSTFRFPIPVINKGGSYTLNGGKYRMRRQFVDKPIRKVGPTKVALSTYYSKVNIFRSTRAAYSYNKWLSRQIEIAKNEDDSKISNLRYNAGTFETGVVLPRVYTAIASRYNGFDVDDLHLDFRYSHRLELADAKELKKIEKNGVVVCGKRKSTGELITVDGYNRFYVGKEELGSIENILDLPGEKAPIDFNEIKLMGKKVPIAFVLCYYYGIFPLLRKLGAEYRTVQRGQRMNLTEDEFAVRFSDETLILSRNNKMVASIFNGFNLWSRSIENWPLAEFDNQDVYLLVGESNGLNTRFLRELDLMRKLYVDPISADYLANVMGEPTEFDELLLRSCEMLLHDQSKHEMDKSEMRGRGYERFAGFVFTEMLKGIRQQRSGALGMKKAVDINPHAVLQTIQEDPANIITEEANPVHNTKEKEICTFVGAGGRTERAMTRKSRVYHETDVGIVSEGTTDSGMVGINVYMVPDANITDLYGSFSLMSTESKNVTKMMSTSALLSPGADRDD